MKRLILLSFIPIFFFTENILPQDTAIIKFFPLNVGNRWVYNRTLSYPVPPGNGKNDVKIESSFISFNHRYYVLKTIVYDFYGAIYSTYTGSYRIDSLTGNIYLLGLTNECLVDSLKLRKNDSTTLPCGGYWWTWVKCTDTSTYSIFGQTPKSKTFSSYSFEGSYTRVYAKNFGRVYEHYGAQMSWTTLTLKGCIINGILYGDTNLVGITQISSEVPENFSLSQNYPNPFNPTTTIRFSIQADSRLRLKSSGNDKLELKVFDVLGREVAVLVNEHLQPGTYEVEFDPEKSGQAGLSSGVYYYKLTAGDYSETKKMVLIK